MDLKLLKDFLSLARTQNFSRSAAERNVTQSAFSRRIQALEIWLGTSLVDRSTYPTKLTAAGVLFRESAEETLRSLYRTRDELRSQQQLDQDTISFSAQHTISLWFFPKWLSKIKAELGPTTARLTADNMHNCIQALAEENCDFLVCYYHPSLPVLLDPERYPHRILGTDRLVPASAPQANGKPRYALPGTKKVPLPHLAYSGDVYFGSAIEFKMKQQSKPCQLRKIYENAMAESLKAMAIEGHGLAWLPRSSIERDLRSKRLVRAGDRSWDIPLEVRIYRSLDNTRPRTDEVWALLSKPQK